MTKNTNEFDYFDQINLPAVGVSKKISTNEFDYFLINNLTTLNIFVINNNQSQQPTRRRIFIID